VHLNPDRAVIGADGQGVAVVTVAIADAQGRTVPTAGNLVRFSLEGPGRIIGVGNGDPSCHEPDVYFSAPTLRAVAIDQWRWKAIDDPYVADRPEEAAAFDDSAWAPADASAEAGPLKTGGSGVFRAHFNVTADDLATSAVELRFGRIEGDGSVYLNGHRLGGTGNPRSATIFSVKDLLHPGENTVAVAIRTYAPTGGLAEGVALRFVQPAPPVAWSRSAFNGLAQVIVQSDRGVPGAIRLTAAADGLQSATLALTAQAVPLPPAVP